MQPAGVLFASTLLRPRLSLAGGPGAAAGEVAPGLRRTGILPVLPILLLAFLARLVPVLHGGGLFGYGNYDDGVYFAASVGLVDGRLPYRDFLLLHPPGVLLALAPFAALTKIISDPYALAVARIGWMLLGVVNCALVVRILTRWGRFAAVVGGLTYAVFFPAVYSEHATLLEAPANTVLLVALLLLVGTDRSTRGRRWLIIGALLALSPTFKIWGVVPVVVLAGWLAVRHGRRALAWYATGAGLCLAVVVGPFAALAPASAWRLVVADQLGRSARHWQLALRLQGITGLRAYPLHTLGLVLVLFAGLGWLVLVGAAALDARGRLFALLHVVMCGLLLATPVWFTHYPGFISATAALVAGTGAAVLARLIGARAIRDRRPLTPQVRSVLAGAALLGILVTAVPLGWARFGTAFPLARLERSATATTGCVTTDDPVNLVELDVLSRNLARGCPLVVDLGGYSYDLRSAGAPVSRRHNLRWQAAAVTYLRTGSRVVLSRFSRPSNTPFDARTLKIIEGWPSLAHAGHLVVRRPVPDPG